MSLQKPKSQYQDEWERSQGAIYFLAAGSPPIAIKIGTCKLHEVKKRILTIQGMNHEVLEVLGIIPFADGERPRAQADIEEAALHRRFAETSRFNGAGRSSEWFYPSEELLAYITDSTRKPEEFGIPKSVALLRIQAEQAGEST
jgi:hypothetical protein